MSSSEKDPIEELWDHRHDPKEWGEEAVEIEARPTGSTVVSFRLPYEEYEALEDAASEKGESLSEFIREAVRIRLRAFTIAEQVALATIVEMTYGGAREFKMHTSIPVPSGSTGASSVPRKSVAPDRDLAGTTP